MSKKALKPTDAVLDKMVIPSSLDLFNDRKLDASITQEKLTRVCMYHVRSAHLLYFCTATSYDYV